MVRSHRHHSPGDRTQIRWHFDISPTEPQTIYSTQPGGGDWGIWGDIMKTTDGGRTWDDIKTGLPHKILIERSSLPQRHHERYTYKLAERTAPSGGGAVFIVATTVGTAGVSWSCPKYSNLNRRGTGVRCVRA